jgi:hypothetical protein
MSILNARAYFRAKDTNRGKERSGNGCQSGCTLLLSYLAHSTSLIRKLSR